MGCTESVPIAKEFDKPHTTTGNALAAGTNTDDEVCKSSTKQKIIVREKMFCLTGNTFKIKKREGTSFGNLGIRGGTVGPRNEMVLENTITKEPIAVCLRSIKVLSQGVFKIYTMKPNFTDQKPSERKCDGKPLYTYAEIIPVGVGNTVSVHLEKKNKNEEKKVEKVEIIT